MPVIAVVNRKGGSGKTTVSTHLAAFCSRAGWPVMLGDADAQRSAHVWLRERQTQAEALKAGAQIVGWNIEARSTVVRPPAGFAHVVLDTPGGMRGFDLAKVVMYADAILMPVCNSVFDRESAKDCYTELQTLPRVAAGKCRIAAVGMRLDARTKASEVLQQWARDLTLPFLGVLRETQLYVRCAEQGLSLFDLPADKVQADLVQWQPILEWLRPVLNAKPSPTEAHRPNAESGFATTQFQSTRLQTALPSEFPAGQKQPSPLPASAAAPAANKASRLGRWAETIGLPRFLQRRS